MSGNLNQTFAVSNDYEETVIIDRLGNEQAAKSIGEFIHCDNIIRPGDNDVTHSAEVDFTIILGKDFNGQYVIKRRK